MMHTRKSTSLKTHSAGVLTGLLPCVLVLVFACGCCSHKPQDMGASSITISCGGGFSGMWSGFTISSTGEVRYNRTMRGVKEESDALGVLDRDDMDNIVDELRDAGVLQMANDGTGNMTTRLYGYVGGSPFNLSWSGVDTDLEQVPEALLPAYKTLMKILQPYRDKAAGDIPMHSLSSPK